MSYQNAPPTYDDESVELQDSNFRQLDTDYYQEPKATIVPFLGTFSELKDDWRHTMRVLFAEWWGTMLFVYIGTGSVMAAIPNGAGIMDEPSVILISLGFGFGIATMVYATANISGGHLNPAVTIAIVASRKMSIIKGSVYLFSQLAGAMVGSALLKLSIPNDICEFVKYGATTLANNATFGAFQINVTVGGGLVMEFILTFLLVFTVFATASLPGDSKDMGKFAPLSIGFAVLVCHIVGTPYTGPSMNPARSFGPAVVGGTWTHHWVYWLGPIMGGLFAAFTYNYGMAESAEKSKAVSQKAFGLSSVHTGR